MFNKKHRLFPVGDLRIKLHLQKETRNLLTIFLKPYLSAMFSLIADQKKLDSQSKWLRANKVKIEKELNSCGRTKTFN